MIECVKAYNVFVSRNWLRWCLNVIYPVVIILLAGILHNYAGYYTMACMGIVSALVVFMELLADTMVFFRVGARNTNQLEYLKTSNKGMEVLKKGLILDAVRRFIVIAFIYIGVYEVIYLGSGFGENHSDINFIGYIIATILCIETALMVLRLFNNMRVMFTAIYFICNVAMGVGILICRYNISAILTGVLVVASIIVAIMARRILIKRGEESYYDR